MNYHPIASPPSNFLIHFFKVWDQTSPSGHRFPPIGQVEQVTSFSVVLSFSPACDPKTEFQTKNLQVNKVK